MYDNGAIEPYDNILGASSLELKERYDIRVGEEWLQVRRDFLPCHLSIQYVFVFHAS